MNVLDIKEVMKRTRLSRMTIYRLERRGEFPRRVQLSPNRVGWHDDLIEEWIASRPHSHQMQRPCPNALLISPMATKSTRTLDKREK